MKSLLGRILVAGMLALALLGCGKGDTGETGVPPPDPAQSAADAQKQMQEIQNNPNIPQAQKDAIIGRMKSQGALGEAGKATAPGK